ncbi:MAG: hypothetical protein IV100_00780 [Myxococcales bacterium]|nr:hypothetical protein [Myxococcales bacterium]
MRLLTLLACSVSALVFASCTDAIGVTAPDTTTDTGEPPGFDDHTVREFKSHDDYLELNDLGELPVQCKFVVTGFQDEPGEVVFLDPRFYRLHDEWYWFRLLNGQPVNGADEDPVEGLSFESIAAIYAAYQGEKQFPIELFWSGERLASNRFYNLALGRCKTAPCPPRTFGVGSVVYLPPSEGRVVPEAIWALELEYIDTATEALLLQFMAHLEGRLPSAAQGAGLKWLARTSPQQESLANTLRAGNGPLKDRVLTYEDLVTPGEVRSYNPGITAGRIKRIRAGELTKVALDPTDIVILEEVPDDLPPVAGIITAVPQTPQAHFNLLAIARGTPNAYMGGVFADGALASLEADRTPVIFQVKDDVVRWQPMSASEWESWQQKSGREFGELVPAPLEGMPYTRPIEVTPGPGALEVLPELVPVIGGKSAGLAALTAYDAIPGPYEPLAITVRAYAEFVAPIQTQLAELIADPEFAKDRRVRQLLLEGEPQFVESNGEDLDAMRWLETFKAGAHRKVIWDLLKLGGVQGLFLGAQAMPEGLLNTLTADLEARFAALSTSQGLRFRSSSTAEDVEGFNGAGVYTSETAFLKPEVQSKASDRKKTVAVALRKVWASFWSFGAFEERENAGLDHLNGRMGVSVHPRFDDAAELANGVFLLSLSRATGDDEVTLTLNVQAGALSVTNPPPGSGITPEVDAVTGTPTAPVVERVLPSSESDAPILTDAELIWIRDLAAPLAADWLDAKNAVLPPGRRSKSITLDFEFRKVIKGFPAMTSGPAFPERIVIKQVRPLSRNGTISATELGVLQVPNDVLAAALRVDRTTCQVGFMQVLAFEVMTDPAVTTLPWSEAPFLAEVRVRVLDGDNPLGLALGTEFVLPHHTATLGRTDAPGFSLAVSVPEGSGFDTLTLVHGGAWAIQAGDKTASGDGVLCSVAPVALSPEAWLESLLD